LARVLPFLLAFSAQAVVSVSAGVDARMLRYPDVSADRIAFVYAGDIWVAPKAGGTASRLSTPRGEEVFPRFSPDGQWIAFTGNYDGNADIYIVAANGGEVRRLTHHPAPDRMIDWFPDGKSILFASPMTSGTNRFFQLYRLSIEGGLPERLPVPYGEFGSVSDDGKQLAYLPLWMDFRTWKRYRGGSTSDIWLVDLARKTSRNLTPDKSDDSLPMWHGSKVYFISDRDAAKRHNIWSVDTKSGGQPKQITKFDTLDVAFPAIGPQDLVFSLGPDLYRMDLASERAQKVEIDVVTDRATLKPHHQSVSDNIFWAEISPSGKRAVFEARGEIFSVPAENGPTRNLTRSSGAAERNPAWSPDGKSIAYFSDRSGEYELTVTAADGSGEERKLSTLGPGFRYHIFWSPDSKKIVFVDQTMSINLFDVERKRVTRIDRDRFLFEGGLQGFVASWSADSRWVAYSRAADSRNTAIFLYDTTQSEAQQVTSGFYSDAVPTFDPDGKYLYYLSNRSFAPSYSDLDNSWVYANSTHIVAVPLRRDVASPLAPRNDDEGEDEKKDRDKKDGKSDDEKDKKKDDASADKDKDKKNGDDEGDKKDEKKPPEPVRIDLERFEERVVILPPPAGNYNDLSAASGKVIYRRGPRTGDPQDTRGSILFWDLEKREEKTIVGKADGYDLSADSKKMLVRDGDKYSIIEVAADQKLEKTLDLSGLAMELDPPAEWRQMFNDAWRFERDYFYDPNMHGVDWKAMRTRYGDMLDDAITRWDLNFLLGELIAELNASHAYRGGGDTEQPAARGVGLLGCDFELHDGAYRIARIVTGAPWDSSVRSPLAEPGADVKQGDYLLAVNGIPLDPKQDPWAPFEGLAGKTVELTVNAKPSHDGSRRVLVKTLESEQRLRNLAWIDANRRKVDEATGGRVGYVYVPDTGIGGQTELVRMFQGQYMKPGLIIDERFNSGGQIPDRFIEMLNRPLYNYWKVRDGEDWQWPPFTHTGPKAMLINPWSGSGGDLFPWYFKKTGLGPLIGTTTWGGLIGISGSPGLIDGGFLTVPTFGIYTVDGKWVVENEGVAPDIEVVDDPGKMLDGGDPQLERAIAEVLKSLETKKPAQPRPPAYPNRSGR
jgi:tricorn protease